MTGEERRNDRPELRGEVFEKVCASLLGLDSMPKEEDARLRVVYSLAARHALASLFDFSEGNPEGTVSLYHFTTAFERTFSAGADLWVHQKAKEAQAIARDLAEEYATACEVSGFVYRSPNKITSAPLAATEVSTGMYLLRGIGPGYEARMCGGVPWIPNPPECQLTALGTMFRLPKNDPTDLLLTLSKELRWSDEPLREDNLSLEFFNPKFPDWKAWGKAPRYVPLTLARIENPTTKQHTFFLAKPSESGCRIASIPEWRKEDISLLKIGARISAKSPPRLFLQKLQRGLFRYRWSTLPPEKLHEAFCLCSWPDLPILSASGKMALKWKGVIMGSVLKGFEEAITRLGYEIKEI